MTLQVIIMSCTEIKLIRRKDEDVYHHRFILKNGDCNVFQPISNRYQFLFLRYAKLVDSSWTFTISMFLLVLSISWALFAVLYWLICLVHGDFEPNHLPEFQEKNNFKPCIYDVRDFSSCFLFSMEAQHTVGYGTKAPSDECAEAIFVNAIHCILGFIMQGFMAAITFSKMTKPRIRSRTLMFSKKAVVCPKKGKQCFMCRVGDIRPRHIVDTRIRAVLVESTETEGRELISCNQTELVVHMDECYESIFFNWPILIHHVIDENSPLKSLSPADLLTRKFEIMVIIEGTDETTGQVTQAKSSYIHTEILWNYQFENMLKFDALRDEYEVDFSKFDSIIPVKA